VSPDFRGFKATEVYKFDGGDSQKNELNGSFTPETDKTESVKRSLPIFRIRGHTRGSAYYKDKNSKIVAARDGGDTLAVEDVEDNARVQSDGPFGLSECLEYVSYNFNFVHGIVECFNM